ncbi:hypothetical protein SAMN05518801_104254 [Novosphingobium sp. CF614]|uniref:hypothetical protein n=1 Tax=Novosphingobium sp. CF614 TaxID=1884364 RepID=UPI0008EEC8C9|nr:hypothetical protein [Novosphingobium sp. CF614]SFF97131.1 hypothetical protein SAMN05518801_104254 [Novosphingobium sp. CF614]
MRDNDSLPPAMANQFSRDSKISEAQTIRLAYAFCAGLPVSAAAGLAGVSAKSARVHYLAFRKRIAMRAFNRWHGNASMLVSHDIEITEVLLRPAFFDLLAECHDNAKCAQNYRLGYRKVRECRSCPLIGKFSDLALVGDVYTLIDAVHGFYRRIGIKSEADRDPVSLFRERLAHTVAIAAAARHSRKQASGLPDPLDKDYLSVGTLLDKLLENLAGDPL